MSNIKAQWQSTTIISAAVTIIAAAATLIGYQVTEAAQQELVTMITAGITLAGGVGAWYGRVRATKLIK